MVIAFILGLALFSSTYQMQKKYDFCKAEKFKPAYCKMQKELNKFEK